MPAGLALAEEELSIQRAINDLQLGDSLRTVEKIYPPLQDWPSYVEPRGGVNRIRIERGSAQSLPAHIETLWLGFKKDRLVEIKIVYDALYTREKPQEELAGDLALIYGEPRRSGNRIWWSDGATVLRALNEPVPVLTERGRKVVELRTCLQLMDEELLRRKP